MPVYSQNLHRMMTFRLYASGILCFLLFFAGSSYAQSGVNIQTGIANTFVGSEDCRSTASVGLNVFADDKSLLFIPGIHYVKMSLYPTGQHELLSGYRTDPAMHFGKVQLFVGKRFLKNKRFNCRVYGGGYTQLLVKVDDNLENINEEHFPMGNFGLEGGLGVRLYLLTLDIKYTYGLTKFHSDAPERLRSLGFHAGLFF